MNIRTLLALVAMLTVLDACRGEQHGVDSADTNFTPASGSAAGVAASNSGAGAESNRSTAAIGGAGSSAVAHAGSGGVGPGAGQPATGGSSARVGAGGPLASAGISGSTASAGSGGAGSGGAGSRGVGSSGSGGSSAGNSSAGVAAVGGSGSNASLRPCDIFAQGDTPCVAAHSTVRALYGAYTGNLYQVRRSSDSATLDIGVLSAGGVAAAAAQDAFCAGKTCVITVLYDQSGHGNHLEYQGQGSSVGGQDKPANASSEALKIGGQKVYSLYINPGNSYWRDGHSSGVPTGSAPEGIYMVTSGVHVNSGCCFDYGNSETTRSADGAGAMDAIYFGTSCWFGGCSGTGPWVQADLEYGLFPGGSSTWNTKQVAFTSKYVTAMLKNNGTSRFALKGGDAQTGTLATLWDGALPRGYSPMKKQGAIVLGSGGDCCARNTNLSLGTFYEGAIVSGYPTDATDDAIQQNIVSAGYTSAP